VQYTSMLQDISVCNLCRYVMVSKSVSNHRYTQCHS